MSGTIAAYAGRKARRVVLVTLLASAPLTAIPAHAQDATWLASPGSNEISTATNWTGGTVPRHTAIFGASDTTSLTQSGFMTVGGWAFTSGGPAYAIANSDVLQFDGVGIVTNGAGVALTNNNSLAFFQSSGAGTATITNNSDLIFFESSTAGSAAITNTGYLKFFGSSAGGNAGITNSGTLAFFHGSSAGAATITNTGALSFLSNSNAASATIINNNIMRFFNDSSAGSAVITNSDDLGFLQGSTAGSATITNTGYVTFTGTSSAGTATIINNDNVSFSNTASAGSAAITNNDNVSFSNTASAASATITNNGFLSFQDSATAGSAAIGNSGWIYFQSSSTAGNAVISGAGSTFFFGSSTTGNATLTSGGGGFVSLQTTDTSGMATVTVQSGGTLLGYGAVGNTIIQSGGTFQPVTGTLRVNGNLTVNAGAAYIFSPGSLALVAGVAALAGTLQLQSIGASFQTQNYTVLTAVSGVNGSLSLTDLYGARLTYGARLIYGANDLTLVIDAYKAAAALGAAGTRNTTNVANAIDTAVASGATPPAAFNALLGQSGSGLSNALNSLTGEAGTVAQATSLSTASTFLGIMLDPMAGARGATASAPGSSLIEMADTGLTPAARVAAGWSVWTKAFGQAGRSASDAGTGAAGTASTVFGVAAGADRIVSPGTLVGFALAGGGTAFGLGGRGSGTGEYMQLGLYGSTKLGEGYLSAALGYGWNRFDVSRRAGLGLIETYSSSLVAHTFGSRIEAGRRFGSRAFAVTPYAAIEAIGFASGAYRETFAPPATGAFALAYGARTIGTVRTEAGLRVDGMRAVGPTADLLTFGRIAYAWQAVTQRAADASFQQLANSGFTVFGARASTYTLLATLGTEIRLATRTRATAFLDGELGDRHRAIRANVGMSHSW